MWNRFQTAASTASLQHSPASPLPTVNLNVNYTTYIDKQQQQQQQKKTPNHKPKTLRRIRTHHGALRVKEKSPPPLPDPFEALCRQDRLVHYEIRDGKVVRTPTSSNPSSRCPSPAQAPRTAAAAPSPAYRADSPPYRLQPLVPSNEPSPPQSEPDSACEYRLSQTNLDQLRRVRSDLNWRTTYSSHDSYQSSRLSAQGVAKRTTASNNSNLGVTTQRMYTYGHYQAGPVEPISPPSSPELNEELNYDISPIDDEDEDWELPQQYFLRTEEPPPPSKPEYQPPTPQQQQQQPQQPQQPRQYYQDRDEEEEEEEAEEHHHQQRTPPSAQDSFDSVHQRSRASSGASAQRPRTNIPAMRRERRKLQDAAANANREQRLNGLLQSKPSPTTASSAYNNLDTDGARRGRSLGVAPDPSHDLGSTTTITSDNQQQRRTYNVSPSFGERMRQFGRNKHDTIENRPAWNGASGRQPIVEPLRDDPNAAPLTINTQNTKRSADRRRVSQAAGPENSYGAAAAAAVRKFMPGKSHQAVDGRSQAHIYPETGTNGASGLAAPLASSIPTRNDAAYAPPHETYQNGSVSAGHPRHEHPDNGKAIKRKPPPASLQPFTPSHAVEPSMPSSVYSSHIEARALTESPQLGYVPSSDETELTGPWAQPPPRPVPAFSSENTTPSTSSPASPRPSPGSEPVSSGSNPLPSVMDRRRPLRGKESPQETSEDPIVISLRTATYAREKAAAEAEAKLQRNSRPSSVMSTSKDLPLAPPEMVESDDRVAVLNAKLLGLAHRRNNLNKSIHQMTELMPKDVLMASAELHRKREDEKRKVDMLKMELDDIQQQEFDLGLKLHRAYKRRERESEFDNSGSLWIRRITG